MEHEKERRLQCCPHQCSLLQKGELRQLRCQSASESITSSFHLPCQIWWSGGVVGVEVICGTSRKKPQLQGQEMPKGMVASDLETELTQPWSEGNRS